MKLIELYKEWMEAGYIYDTSGRGFGGLCNAVPREYKKLLLDFEPEEYKTYWASMLPKKNICYSAMYKFNDLRQTIVLFICAMHDEL